MKNKTCIILGDKSDIGKQLRPMLEFDGWNVIGWRRGGQIPTAHWDLVLYMAAQLGPVGLWHNVDPTQWQESIYSNLTLAMQMLWMIWRRHNPGASVCLFAGPNPHKPMANYSAYSAGKIGLLKACEHFDLESLDVKFFALGPGVVLTKIHKATTDAGIKNEVLERAKRDGGVPISRIYSCLKWCIAQKKSVVGGRNICVSDSFDWEAENELQRMLEGNTSMFKLRRSE